MLKIAVTGKIATGKSTVLEVFKNRGIPVLSADGLVKSFQSPGNIIWQRFKQLWGRNFFDEKGEINREKVAGKLLTSPAFKKKLEKISHPAVKSEIEKIFRVWESEGKKAAAAEIPLLFQCGWENFFDIVILTTAGKRDRVERVAAKRDIPLPEAEKWVGFQEWDPAYRKRATLIIDTSGDLKETVKRTEDIIKKIKEEKR